MMNNSSSNNKRSISSMISSFFKKFPDCPIDQSINQSVNGSGAEISEEYNSDKSSGSIIKRPRLYGERPNFDTCIGDGKMPELILYECEGGLRPPVLPILPLQRLRMLKYKQELRRQKYHMVDAVFTKPRKHGHEMTNTDGDVSWDCGIKAITTERSSKIADETSLPNQMHKKGRLWCCNFEYDLAEYDSVKKQRLNNKDALEIPSNSPKLDNQLIMRNSLSTAESLKNLSSTLSRAQLMLLAGSSPEHLTMNNTESNNTEKNSKVFGMNSKDDFSSTTKKQVPSIGFDFLSKNDISLNTNNPEVAESPSREGSLILHRDGPKKPTCLALMSNVENSFENIPQNSGHSFNADRIINGTNDLGQEPVNGTTCDQEVSDFNSEKDSIKPKFKFDMKVPQKSVNSTNKTSEKSFNFLSKISEPYQVLHKNEDEQTCVERKSPLNDDPTDSLTSKPTNLNPSFTFGDSAQKKADMNKVFPNSESKFSFGGFATTSEHKPEEFSFSFKNSSNEKELSTKSPPDVSETMKPGFSYENKIIETKDSTSSPFNFGTKPVSKNNDPPKVLSLGATIAENRDTTSKPFTFGPAPTEAKHEKQNVISTDVSQPSSTGAKNSNLFNTSAPSTKHANSLVENNPPKFTSSLSAPVTSHITSNSAGFKFDLTGFQPGQVHGNNSAALNSDNNRTFDNNRNLTNGGFGVQPGSLFGAPQNQPTTAGFNFSQNSVQPSNFEFHSRSTTANSSSAFGGSSNSLPLNGINFENPVVKKTNSSVLCGIASSDAPPTQNFFQPAASINMNFGGSSACMTPAQIFTHQDTPSSSNGNGSMYNQHSTTQIPPGRRIARMRARRG